jgi:hypothetical protein
MIRNPFRQKWQYGLKTNFHGSNLIRRATLSRTAGTKMPNRAMKRVFLILALTTAAGIGIIIGVGYAATMGVVGHFAPTLKSLPSDYGIEAETISFKSPDGLDLKGWWVSAQGNSASPATVILAHGK